MTERPEAHDRRLTPADDELDRLLRDPYARAWFNENLPRFRRYAEGQHFLFWSLGIGFVVGVATYVSGYELRTSVTTEPLGLVADFLYTLGWALWTGVVVVVFLEVVPKLKRRQVKRALEAYEAAQGDVEPPPREAG